MALLAGSLRKGTVDLDELIRKGIPRQMAVLATTANVPRTRIAAAKVLLAMELANLRAKEKEIGRRHQEESAPKPRSVPGA
jgi:hypothetical protein